AGELGALPEARDRDGTNRGVVVFRRREKRGRGARVGVVAQVADGIRAGERRARRVAGDRNEIVERVWRLGTSRRERLGLLHQLQPATVRPPPTERLGGPLRLPVGVTF